MHKISSYLYPNRVALLADLAGFPVEWTNVYQRTVKIYSGIDNTIEFDIKNADQKRIDLTNYTLSLNVMDASGNALPNSPYSVTKLNQGVYKGLAKVVLPKTDLEGLKDQYFKYSVTALDQNDEDVLFYGDTRFGALGTMELVGSAMPKTKAPLEYTTFTGEIDLNGNVKNHFSAMPVTYYEAVPTENVMVTVYMTGFKGKIYLEGTTHSTISVESFKNGIIPNTEHTFSSPSSTCYRFTYIPINEYKYIRVSFVPDDPKNPTGSIDKVVLEQV